MADIIRIAIICESAYGAVDGAYGNGKDYYKYHGSKLLVLPQNEIDLTSSEFLEWHNNEIYRG